MSDRPAGDEDPKSERFAPGSTDPRPAGQSSETPAEGADDTPPERPGSPQA